MISSRRSGTLRECGFTLLEMVIALTLVAMMAVSLWGLLRIGIRSWQRGTESVDSNQRHRTVLDLVKKQLASIYGLVVPADPQAGGGYYPVFAGTETSLQCISLNSLRFYQSPGLTMVSYDVVRDRRGDYSLVERERQYLGFDPARESLFDREPPEPTVIFDRLVSVMFEYYDPGSTDRPAEWLRAWDAREMGRLPAAISMTMVAIDVGGERFSRHMVIPVAAKPQDPRLRFANPFESVPARMRIEVPARPPQ